MWQTLHGYEQEFRDILSLPAQNDFPSIFSKHLWSFLMGESVRPYNVFQNLKFDIVYGRFSTVFNQSCKIEKVISNERLN